MKITIKKSIAKLLCLTTCVSAISAPLIACNDDESDETRALILATDALDTVFNPFFYTSGPDGDIVSQTQIGMLSSDKNGDIVAGWNEPCVALDWSYVKHGKPGDVQGNNYNGYQTDYYFAIKDNILFSDGTPLTKDDVLFNLYMYLDPAYTGSNTMYSVKIQGLTEYRTQTRDLNNASGSDNSFEFAVKGRRSAVVAWIEDEDALWDDQSFDEYEYKQEGVTATDKTLKNDILKIEEYFKTSLNETWTTVISADIEKEYEKYKDKDGNAIFTEPWQLFLYYYGVFTVTEEYGNDNKISHYSFENNYPKDSIPATAEEREGETFKNELIQHVFDSKFIDREEANESYKNNLLATLNSYPVNVYMHDYWLADVKHRKFADNMQVKNVSGIKIERKSSIPVADNNGVVSERKLFDADGANKEYDVLHITINGVDPKAKQNFGFTVAPGHYYSNKEEWDKAIGDNNADDEYFGVKFSDPAFMDMVRVKHLPMGAGPFVAAKSEGGVATEKSQFFGSNNIVNFEANENFLLGAPKIKKLRYKVISSSQLYTAVQTGEVHYASPSMKRDDINTLINDNSLNSENAENLGYGYIGISARYIPNIYIRKAIMTTLNANTCITSYYGDNGGSVIVRPMSKTLTQYYDSSWTPYYEFDGTGKAADALLRDGGCDFNHGVWYDEKGNRLKYTFTIAGDSDDHPANSMLLQSAKILNDHGWDITVTHDSTALSKLSSGLLTVWAAAWSSSSDPDMYQVYHKDSQATSTAAWGYRYIFSSEFKELSSANNKRHFKGQQQMINDLSDLIDDGRETDVPAERKIIYDKALDQLMDLAVEFPTYQRKVYYIWRKGVFKEETMIRGTGNVTSYQSPLSRIWEVEMA